MLIPIKITVDPVEINVLTMLNVIKENVSRYLTQLKNVLVLRVCVTINALTN
jgi:hypothetical protein